MWAPWIEPLNPSTGFPVAFAAIFCGPSRWPTVKKKPTGAIAAWTQDSPKLPGPHEIFQIFPQCWGVYLVWPILKPMWFLLSSCVKYNFHQFPTSVLVQRCRDISTHTQNFCASTSLPIFAANSTAKCSPRSPAAVHAVRTMGPAKSGRNRIKEAREMFGECIATDPPTTSNSGVKSDFWTVNLSMHGSKHVFFKHHDGCS